MNAFKLETNLGNVWLTPTQGDHIFVQFGNNLNVAEEGPAGHQRQGPIKIRGVAYAGSIHAHLWGDGQWHLGAETDNRHQALNHHLYLSRQNAKNYDASLPSHAARETAATVIMAYVNKWAKANQAELDKAEVTRRANERQKRVEKIVDLTKQIAKLQSEMAELDATL